MDDCERFYHPFDDQILNKRPSRQLAWTFRDDGCAAPHGELIHAAISDRRSGLGHCRLPVGNSDQIYLTSMRAGRAAYRDYVTRPQAAQLHESYFSYDNFVDALAQCHDLEHWHDLQETWVPGRARRRGLHLLEPVTGLWHWSPA